MEEEVFWGEVRRWRRYFFLTWIGWLVVGFPLWRFYALILPAENPMVAGTAALFTWAAFWQWVVWRLRSIRCYRCGAKAIAHPYFFMKDARCQNCGVAYRKT